MKVEEIFLEKFWGKPISVFFLGFILCLGAIPFIPNEKESYISIVLYVIIAFVFLVAYLIYVISKNKLPSCKKDEIGVLFIFKVASEKQYKEFQFSIENNFNENAKEKAIKIKPIFLNAAELKNYDRNNTSYMVSLLSKTNCYFCIEFFVESDSLDNPTEYLTTINTGVLHPNVSKESVEFLIKNLSLGNKPVRKLKFNSKDKINALKITSNYLTVLSKYAISILLIMSNRISDSIGLLTSLHNNTNHKHILYKMICEALYEASFHKFSDYLNKYKKSYDKAFLDKLEHYLTLANIALPNQYNYHLNMAQVIFLKYRNIDLANKHINFCKIIGDNDYWKYSEAFLLAYETNDPNIVYGRYKSLKNNSYNVIDIVAFIEAILSEEKEKSILHLALGVLYDTHDYPILASCHFRQFIDNYDGEIPLRKNTLKTIKNKIDYAICKENQGYDNCNTCFQNR